MNETDTLLRRRARELAEPPAGETPRVLEVLELGLGGETLAVPLARLERVIAWNHPVPLPGAPEWVLGVQVLEGTALPIADLRPFWNLERSRPEPTARVVLLRGNGLALNLFAESVAGDSTLDPEELRSPTTDSRFRWIRGISSDGRLLLDCDALLADPDLWLGETSPPTPTPGISP